MKQGYAQNVLRAKRAAQWDIDCTQPLQYTLQS